MASIQNIKTKEKKNDKTINILINKFINEVINTENKKSDFGLVYKDKNYRGEGECILLGVFKNNTIRYFKEITDPQDIYSDLPLTKFSFVDIKHFQFDDEVGKALKDICTFENMRNNKIMEISEMLKVINFPNEESDKLFNYLLVKGMKSIEKDAKKNE